MKTLTKMLAVAACALAPLQARGAWEVVPNVPTGVDLHDVAVGGVGNVVVAVGDGGTIVRSDDLGATWSIVSCPTTQDLISLNNGGSHLRAGGAGGDSPQSFDGGVTWQFFGTNPPGTSPEIFSKATSVAFVATAEGGLYRTTNAGVSWQEQISPTGVPFHAGAGTTGSPGLVVGDQGTIWHTTNGVDWAPVTSGTDVALRDCEGPNVYSIVVGDGGTILTSDQNAISWTPRSSGTTANLNAFDRFGDAHAIVVGDGGVILWSTDSGEPWCALPSGTPANLRGVAFVGAEAVAVGDGHAGHGRVDGRGGRAGSAHVRAPGKKRPVLGGGRRRRGQPGGDESHPSSQRPRGTPIRRAGRFVWHCPLLRQWPTSRTTSPFRAPPARGWTSRAGDSLRAGTALAGTGPLGPHGALVLRAGKTAITWPRRFGQRDAGSRFARSAAEARDATAPAPRPGRM